MRAESWRAFVLVSFATAEVSFLLVSSMALDRTSIRGCHCEARSGRGQDQEVEAWFEMMVDKHDTENTTIQAEIAEYAVAEFAFLCRIERSKDMICIFF